MDYRWNDTDINYVDPYTNEERIFTITGAFEEDASLYRLDGIRYIDEDNQDCYICSSAFEWKDQNNNGDENYWNMLPVKPDCHCHKPLCYGCIYKWISEAKPSMEYDEDGNIVGWDNGIGMFTCPACRGATNRGCFLLSQEEFQRIPPEEEEEEEDIETDPEEFPEDEDLQMPDADASLEQYQVVVAELLEKLMKSNQKIASLKTSLKNSEKARKALRTTNKGLRERLAGKEPRKKKEPAKRKRPAGSGIKIEPAKKTTKIEEPIDLDDLE